MKGFQKPWFIAGGWAVDIALGRVTRAHDDIDICIYREEVKDTLQHFEGWEIKTQYQVNIVFEQLNDLALPRYCLHLFREDNFIEVFMMLSLVAFQL